MTESEKSVGIGICMILPVQYVALPNSVALYLKCVHYRLTSAKKCVVFRLVPRSQNDPGSWIRMIHDPWFLEILDPIATVLSKDPKDHRSCPETLSLDLIDLGSCPETLSLDLIDLGSCPETLLLDLIDLGSWTECLSLDPVDLGSWAKHLSWYLKDLGFLDNVSYRSPHGCAPFSLCAATFSFT